MADDKKNISGSNASGGPESKPRKRSKKESEPLIERFKKWFHATRLEFSSEFKKIVWPSREELIKQTITVIVVSLIFGLYVTLLDGGLGFLYTRFAQFASTLL
ncbi:MAG: preprotein translocase subunit SecE [Clostridiales bacterium]|jgi:preprotein translocase subunit SecE|nr:preprotein translocase subunit SecE [Clostridiales bacterium]